MLPTIKSLLRVVRSARLPAQLPRAPGARDACVVLGNGPSLGSDVIGRLDDIHALDSFCVNQFAESELYDVIRPKYYVLADPAYWNPSEPQEMVVMRDSLFATIIGRTSWPLTLCAPFEARQLFIGRFSCSANVRVAFYNNVPLWGAKRILNALYGLGLGIPHVQNVLVAAVFLSLRLRYKTIILLGADHSWHESIVLDDANRVCVRDKHFYDPEAQLKPFAGGMFTMDTLFIALADMFAGHWAVQNYSKHLGAHVYNASSTTFIDAFERRGLADVLAELRGVQNEKARGISHA